MLSNYIIIALRTLHKQKSYTYISIMGLVVSFICYFIINIYVNFEISYDKYLMDYDQLFRVEMKFNPNTMPRTPHPLAQTMVKDFPEIQSAVSLTPIWGQGLIKQNFIVQFGKKVFIEKNVIAADTTFFNVFNLDVLAGDAKKTLLNPTALIITKNIALKYFNSIDVIGKTILLNNKYNMSIGAVIQNIPNNSHLKFDILVSYITYKIADNNSNFFSWADFGHYNYVKLKKGTNVKSLIAKIPAWSKKYIDYSIPDLKSDYDISKCFTLIPIKDIHLNIDTTWELEPGGNIYYVYILYMAAILIVIMGAINFLNLSIAQSLQRAKEVGIRKTLGAERKQIVAQFLSESYLITIISVIIAIIITKALQPVFMDLFNLIELPKSIFGSEQIIITVVLVLFVGALSGFYPAIYLSSISTFNVFKQNISKNSKPGIIRKGLIIFQFTVLIFLIISTLVLNKQMNYLINKDLGFNKNQLIVIPMIDDYTKQKAETIKNELLKNNNIISVSCVSNIPGNLFNRNTIRWNQSENPVGISELFIDHDFFRTMGIKIQEGRGFDKNSTRGSSYLLNSIGAKQFVWKNPIENRISWYPGNKELKGNLIGVVKDFNFESLHHLIDPLLFIKGEYYDFNYMLVKVNTTDMPLLIGKIQNIYEQFLKTYIFEYSFLDKDYERLYVKEAQMGRIFGTFSIVSLLIACMGLYSLSAFSVEKRTKEIGIRKTIGATTSQIIYLLISNYLIWICISAILAVLISWYLLGLWLQEFAYKTSIGFEPFLLGVSISLIVLLITISLQTYKAAISNPVKSLKYE
ncbi:MAG: FtsX-like permease family protein [bacterium]